AKNLDNLTLVGTRLWRHFQVKSKALGVARLFHILRSPDWPILSSMRINVDVLNVVSCTSSKGVIQQGGVPV
ncbi:hypothetical protein FRX31_031139, partial [Thalictrum thalictroides]